MAKYIVMGIWCEKTAILHCEAISREEARNKYESVFSEEQKAGLLVDVLNGAGNHWEYDGYRQHTRSFRYAC